jgi:hypothetical protein
MMLGGQRLSGKNKTLTLTLSQRERERSVVTESGLKIPPSEATLYR